MASSTVEGEVVDWTRGNGVAEENVGRASCTVERFEREHRRTRRLGWKRGGHLNRHHKLPAIAGKAQFNAEGAGVDGTARPWRGCVGVIASRYAKSACSLLQNAHPRGQWPVAATAGGRMGMRGAGGAP